VLKSIAAAGAALLFLPLVAQAAPDTPVKIGVLGDQSGAYSAAGGKGSVEAARLAAEDAGLVLGKPVEIVSADFLLKVDVGVAIARKWYDEDNVDTIIDVPFSGLALAIADMTRTKKKLALFNAASSSELTGAKCSPYVAQWTYDSYSLGRGPTSGLISRGDNSWFFLTNDTVFGTSLEKEASAAVQAAGGTVFVPATGAGLTSQGHRPCRSRLRPRHRRQAGRGIRHPGKRPAFRRADGDDRCN
jgi:branched-chain amino acid transport system substrate-binding protein